MSERAGRDGRADRAGGHRAVTAAVAAVMLMAGCSLRVSTGALETVPTVATTVPAASPALALPTSTSTSVSTSVAVFDECR